MIATLEISMYALSDNYAERVIDFIQRVKKYKGITIEVNGLSTQLFGEYDLLMEVIKKEMKTDFENGNAVFLIKIAGKELTKDKLPNSLK
jgi:uncharacterized protein YqgV (UPF0045/DUF77 family)